MRRAVITGLGAVTPVGNDVSTTWDSLVSGRSGITHITRFDTDDYPVNIAGEVKDFDPAAAMAPKEVRRTGPRRAPRHGRRDGGDRRRRYRG